MLIESLATANVVLTAIGGLGAWSLRDRWKVTPFVSIIAIAVAIAVLVVSHSSIDRTLVVVLLVGSFTANLVLMVALVILSRRLKRLDREAQRAAVHDVT